MGLTVVVDGGQDRNRLFGDIDTGEDGSSFGYTRESLVKNVRWEMAELQIKVVLVRSNATAFTDLNGHTT